MAAREGVRACFANPGTSEMHLVAALDAAPSIRPVLCLFEGVATGAADGYGRMTQTPALTLLHLGPGLGNGFANLHNAYRARTPIVSLVGEHATYHRANNPPLASDIAAIARPVSAWLETAETARDLLHAGRRAIAAARRAGPATLILPADVAWSDDEPEPAAPTPDEEHQGIAGVESAVQALGPRTLLLLGGRQLSAEACAIAQRIAAATGALALIETFPARVRREGGGAELKRLPYLSEMAAATLAQVETVILAGAAYPVAFFALPGRPLRLAPKGAQVIELTPAGVNPEMALLALADQLKAPALRSHRPSPPPKPNSDGAIDPMSLAQCIAATLPDNAIVCDESNTAGLFCYDASASSPSHDWLTLTGGSIGQGLPLATGAAIACPDRRVLALEADGSALYTIQALWTQAREQLNVTNVILNNGAYAILRLEMMRAGVNTLSDAANSLFDLRNPAIDFCAIAQGFGVPAQRVATPQALAAALERSYAAAGPSLIEVMLP
ncbi:MAG: acetolactate synthase large subunit [Caulobacterales bacterium]|jgi:acetolactate synthase-1/2/3 large subunit|nr:acetolactate synthase large subunit [Caulobacterales bacterium]